MRPFRKPTIKDVAAQAGVSVSTVSMFVSGREALFSEATGQRIREAVNALNYVPSAHTRGLRSRATRTIGICATPPHTQPHYSYVERLWYGFMMGADEVDYSLHHYPVSARESVSHTPFLDGLVDGLIFNADGRDTRPAKLADAGMPLVLTGRSLNIPDGCGCVYIDERLTVDMALSHLWEHGHRRIAHLHGPIQPDARESEAIRALPSEACSDIAVQRCDAYVAWTKARGVYDPTLLLPAHNWFNAPEAEEAVQYWLSLPHPPTAIFCANDILALAVMEALRQQGLNLPEQMSVMGVDNIALCGEARLPLTTIDVEAEAMGAEAVRALLRLIQGESVETCRVSLSAIRLVERDSVTVPRP